MKNRGERKLVRTHFRAGCAILIAPPIQKYNDRLLNDASNLFAAGNVVNRSLGASNVPMALPVLISGRSHAMQNSNPVQSAENGDRFPKHELAAIFGNPGGEYPLVVRKGYPPSLVYRPPQV
jgi:hypothetical protein